MKQIISILCLALLLVNFSVGCKQTASQPVDEVKQTENKPVVEGPMEVKASHILVSTKEEAENLKNQLDKGADFAELAKNNSKCPSGKDGGDLGFFSKGQMVPEFEMVAFSLPVNTVSDPVQTQFGWHLIKITDTK